MYKRRDWLYMHGPDGGNSSSEDSDAEGEGDEEGDSGSEDGESSQDTSSNDGEEGGESAGEAGNDSADEEAADGDGGLIQGGKVRRLEDLSEDDFEDGDQDSDDQEETEEEKAAREALDKQLETWINSDSKERCPGKPLRCVLCPKVLILNAPSLKSHLASKNHLRILKRLPDTPEPADFLCFADELGSDEEEAETHTERLERIRSAALGAQPKPKDNRKRKGKKLGKRQREAQKQEAAQGAGQLTNGKKKSSDESSKAQAILEEAGGTKNRTPKKQAAAELQAGRAAKMSKAKDVGAKDKASVGRKLGKPSAEKRAEPAKGTGKPSKKAKASHKGK